jgi:serine/threonine-protein phosphatase PGAM5
MTRAVETAELIVNELGPDKVKHLLEDPDPMLREGAPVRPEPDVGRWKPPHGYHQDGARIEAVFRCRFTT